MQLLGLMIHFHDILILDTLVPYGLLYTFILVYCTPLDILVYNFNDSVFYTTIVRLVGSDGTRGDIEIYDKVYRQWRKLCDDGWNLRAATVVCRQLNLGPPISIYTHAAGRIYGIESVDCVGTESNIAECNYTTDHDCYRDETAGVICNSSKL